jgi:hypothetical protein
VLHRVAPPWDHCASDHHLVSIGTARQPIFIRLTLRVLIRRGVLCDADFIILVTSRGNGSVKVGTAPTYTQSREEDRQAMSDSTFAFLYAGAFLDRLSGAGSLDDLDPFLESLHPIQLAQFFFVLLSARGATSETVALVERHNRRVCPTCSGFVPAPVPANLLALRETMRVDEGPPLRCPDGHPIFLAPADG